MFDFQALAVWTVYEQEKKAPNREALSNTINTLEGRAQFQGLCQEVYTRVAEHDGNVYIDLTNPGHQVVEIDSTGWRVLDNPPVKFRRSTGMLPLPQPVTTGSLEKLRPLINSEGDETWVLDVAWLVGAMNPSGPYPISVDLGEQGAAKSTRQLIKRSTIDSVKAPLRSTPRDTRDLMIAARHGWIICFDNLSYLPDWLSDSFCRLSTGGGFATRQLYTNDDQEIFDARRPLMLNGIENVLRRPDLVDRALILNIPPIPESKRRTEGEIMTEFKRLHPGILGGLLNVVSAALREYPKVELSRLPRMADFAKWVVSGESALSWSPGIFMETYSENRDDAIQTTLEADSVASAILTLMENIEAWEGSPSELLLCLANIVDERTKNSKQWPGSASWLTRRLNRPATFLRAVGIEVDYKHSTDRIITIRKTVKNAVLGGEGAQKSINGDTHEMSSSLQLLFNTGSGGKDTKDGKNQTYSKDSLRF